jgi:hypothetical protein
MNRDGSNCLYGMLAVTTSAHVSLVAPEMASIYAVYTYFPYNYNVDYLTLIVWGG